jgi:hypothetical protein
LSIVACEDGAEEEGAEDGAWVGVDSGAVTTETFSVVASMPSKRTFTKVKRKREMGGGIIGIRNCAGSSR